MAKTVFRQSKFHQVLRKSMMQDINLEDNKINNDEEKQVEYA